MASQIGDTRLYTTVDEATDEHLRTCDVCKVKAVPRGITSTRAHDHGNEEVHCPNCGHVHGRKNH